MLDPDALLTAREAAALLKVTRHVVYGWEYLGRLPKAGRRNGVKVYRLRDLWEAERITRNSPNSHRRVSAA